MYISRSNLSSVALEPKHRKSNIAKVSTKFAILSLSDKKMVAMDDSCNFHAGEKIASLPIYSYIEASLGLRLRFLLLIG